MKGLTSVSATTGQRPTPDWLFILWAGGTALLSYSLVYALRKPFTAAEFHDGSLAEAYMQKHEILGGLKHVVSSDAHYLWDINEADNFIMLKETQTASRTRSALLSWLSGTE